MAQGLWLPETGRRPARPTRAMCSPELSSSPEAPGCHPGPPFCSARVPTASSKGISTRAVDSMRFPACCRVHSCQVPGGLVNSAPWWLLSPPAPLASLVVASRWTTSSGHCCPIRPTRHTCMSVGRVCTDAHQPGHGHSSLFPAGPHPATWVTLTPLHLG